jgi:hypothetical protein
MRSEQKTMREETGRWLRIVTLTLVTLMPLFHTLTSRLPKRAVFVIDEDDMRAVRSELDAQIEAALEKRYKPQQKAQNSFWVALGFGLGLTLAGITTYQLLRRQLQQIDSEGEEMVIL